MNLTIMIIFNLTKHKQIPKQKLEAYLGGGERRYLEPKVHCKESPESATVVKTILGAVIEREEKNLRQRRNNEPNEQHKYIPA